LAFFDTYLPFPRSPPKSCTHFSSLLYMLHAPPISFFLIWSPEQYLVRCTYHRAPCYVVFPIHLLLHPSLGPNIVLSTQFLNTLSLCSSLIMRDQFSHPYKTTGKFMFLYISQSLYFCIANWRTKDSTLHGSKHSYVKIILKIINE
jgi:hypothetical protein